MSIRKGHHESLPVRRPYDDKGKYVPLKCPECGNGSLKYDRDGCWICDGLADPVHDDLPLVTCEFWHVDGDPYPRKP